MGWHPWRLSSRRFPHASEIRNAILARGPLGAVCGTREVRRRGKSLAARVQTPLK